MATVTKRDLVVKVSDKTNLTQQQAFYAIQGFIDEITECLAEGDTVALRNFGSFQVTETKPKIGRNPKKPYLSVKIPARQVVKFKPGKVLKQRVSGEEVEEGDYWDNPE